MKCGLAGAQSDGNMAPKIGFGKINTKNALQSEGNSENMQKCFKPELEHTIDAF